MPRILLVDALARGSGARRATLDVVGAGPRLVAGILESRGVRVDLLPLEEVLSDPWILGGYDVLLASGMSSDKPGMSKLARLWAKVGGGPLVAGGPVSTEYGKLLDYGYSLIVYGEGERQLEALAPHISRARLPGPEELMGIKGVAFRSGKMPVFTGHPGFLGRSELNRYKSSVRVVKGYPNYWASRVYVEVVRGCSNFYRPTIRLADGRKCIECGLCREGPLEARLGCPVNIPAGCGYCSVPALYGPARSRDRDLIVEEVKELVRLGVSRIVLSAPDILDYGRDLLVEPKPLTDPRTPPANLDALEDLFEALRNRVPEIESGEVVLGLENIKANLVTEEVAKLLGRYFAGTPVHIGVETGDPMLVDALGRPVRLDEAERAVQLLKKHGLRPYVYFIHGLPGQTLESARKTASYIGRLGRLGVEKVTTYRFRPLPGSAFEGIPPGRPAALDEASRMIVEAARKVNVEAKKRMVGLRIRAVVAGKYKGRALAYPLLHGPVVLLDKQSEDLRGMVVEAEITGVVDDRMVRGKIVRVLGHARGGPTAS